MSTVLANRYKIEDDSDSLLGMGGMGVVMKGLDQATGAPVAVKILKDGGRGSAYDRELLERFVREGEALRRLNHPNVVKLLDTFEENGRRYLIMELVSGGSLRDLLARGEKLHLSRFLQIAMDVCDALTRAHRLDIIHRDLKPDNVLLDSHGTARVTDFGVAHFEDRTQLTADGALLGTVAYMSPEAVSGEPATTLTDIWAFGVMLYELLAGERPFNGSNPATIISAILQHPLPVLGALRPGVPPELAALISRMLARDAASRVASFREVGVELERLRSHPAFQPGAPETAVAAPQVMLTEVQAFAGKIIPLRLHLVGKFGVPQAMEAVEYCNKIWAPHELVWNCVGCQPLVVDRAALEATFPTHSKEPGHRKATCDALTALPGYDPQAVNVYLTEEVRYLNKDLRASGQEFRDRRVVVVPEKHYREPAGHTLARALGVFLGLTRNSATPEDRLASLSGKGTALSPEEVKEVTRRADKLLAVLAPVTSGPVGAELPVRLRVWLVRGGAYGVSLADPAGLLGLASWLQAGLRFEVDVRDATVPDPSVEAVFPGDDSTPGHKQRFDLLGKAGGSGLNLFVVRELPSAGRKTSYVTLNDRAARLIVATETASPRAVNRALGMFLGLTSNDYALPGFLMGNGTGDRLHPDEIRTVRAAAAKYGG